MDFIYLYENKTKKPLAIALSVVGRVLRWGDDRGNVNIVQYKSKQIVTMNPPV
jgi:hypothetical protein